MAGLAPSTTPNALIQLLTGGPGKVTTGGDVAGGGFGLVGLAEGMAVALALNLLSVTTVLPTDDRRWKHHQRDRAVSTPLDLGERKDVGGELVRSRH